MWCVLQPVAACCSVLQRVATCCSALQCCSVAMYSVDLLAPYLDAADGVCLAAHCNVLRPVAVFQCLSLCCNVFGGSVGTAFG